MPTKMLLKASKLLLGTSDDTSFNFIGDVARHTLI